MLKFLKSKKVILAIAVVFLVLAPSSYAFASYVKSNNLAKQADNLAKAGDYTGAISKYDQAKNKWKWNATKIDPKKATAERYKTSDQYLNAMTVNFGKGEWQKCLDYQAKITKDFPKYSQVQNRYKDCQKKLDEQIAAKKAAAALAAANEQARVAKQVTLSGIVQDYISDKSVADINVTSGQLTAKTNAKGEFALTFPSSGKVAIVFNKDGYLPINKTYNLTKKATNIGKLKVVQSGIVVFDDNRDHTDQKIYSANYDGSNLKVLVPHVDGTDDRYPKLSPDGTKVFFSSSRKGNKTADNLPIYNIFIIDSDGNNLKQIDDKVVIDHQYATGYERWSGDSKKIIWTYLTSNTDGHRQLFVYDVASGNSTRISPSKEVDYRFVINENNQKLAYITYDYGKNNYEVWASNIDGSGEEKLFADENFNRFDNFNGTKLYYTTTSSYKYMLYDLTTRTNTQIAYSKLIHEYTDKSPDGNHLAYVLNLSDSNSWSTKPKYLYISNVDGSNEKLVSNIATQNFAYYPIWAPNSRSIIFDYNNDYYVASIEGGSTKKIVHLISPSSTGA